MIFVGFVCVWMFSVDVLAELPGYQDIKDSDKETTSSVGPQIKTAQRFGTDLGFGANTRYGIFGISAKYFLLEDLDLHFAMGFSSLGSVSSLGANYYFLSKQVAPLGDEFLMKAFFGASLISTNGAKVKKINNLQDADYQVGKGLAINPVVGLAGFFTENLYGHFELGYRSYSKRPEVTFESGFYSASDQEDIEKSAKNDLSLLLTAGWLW